MSNADFSFVECSYNPLDVTYDDVHDKLTEYGFTKINDNIAGTVSVWMQNLSIITLRESSCVNKFAVTGLGFISDNTTIDAMGAEYDEDIAMYVCEDGCALRTILVSEDDMHAQFGELDSKYSAINALNDTANNCGITHISGIVYNCSAENVLDYYYSLGFTLQKDSDDYYTLLSKNKRLTLLCNKHSNDSHVKTVICETDNIFYTVAFCSAHNVETKSYDLNYITNDMFGEHTFKVVGYNCLAHGNKNSYSIEKLAKNVAPDLDILFRMRRQYSAISEENLLKHFEDEIQ
jgi:hypothetical protein